MTGFEKIINAYCQSVTDALLAEIHPLIFGKDYLFMLLLRRLLLLSSSASLIAGICAPIASAQQRYTVQVPAFVTRDLNALAAREQAARDLDGHDVGLSQVIASPFLADEAVRSEVLQGVEDTVAREQNLSAEQRLEIVQKAQQIVGAAAQRSAQQQVQVESNGQPARQASAPNRLVPSDILPQRMIDLRASFTSYPDWLALCVEGHPGGHADNRVLRQLGIQSCISTAILFSSLTLGVNYRFNIFARTDRRGRIHEVNVGPQLGFRWVIGQAAGVDVMASGEYVWWVRPQQLGVNVTADVGASFDGRYGASWYWGGFLGGPSTGFWAIPIFRLMGGVSFR